MFLVQPQGDCSIGGVLGYLVMLITKNTVHKTSQKVIKSRQYNATFLRHKDSDVFSVNFETHSMFLNY